MWRFEREDDYMNNVKKSDAETHPRSEMSPSSIASPLLGMTALVTGAARGIGAAIAIELGRQGARVMATDRDAAALVDTLGKLAEVGSGSATLSLDVTSSEQCFAAIERVNSEFGKTDIVVNAAGLYMSAPFLKLCTEDFQRLLDVNLFGTVNLMQAALPGMLARQYGRIVNLASTAGKRGGANQSAYSVSKHAVIGVTRCVAMEFAKTGVTVNAICPGPVRTEMLAGLWETQAALAGTSIDAVKAGMLKRIPIGRLIEPDEIAAMTAYLVSSQAGGLTGQAITVDGGMLQA
jgi:NAD(P)-dependent dehydrogenase (short-subunit alcohol dehydrogenase family)